MLNVGPTAEGLIPGPSVERLQAIGNWMDVNAESIYEATASPVASPEWGRYTQKNHKIYAHIFDWPENQELEIKGIDNITNAYLLSDKENKLTIEKGEESTSIQLPGEAPDPIATVVVLETGGAM